MSGRHDHTIPLQFASLCDGQEVFPWFDCLLDLGMDFLIGNAVFVKMTALKSVMEGYSLAAGNLLYVQ